MPSLEGRELERGGAGNLSKGVINRNYSSRLKISYRQGGLGFKVRRRRISSGSVTMGLLTTGPNQNSQDPKGGRRKLEKGGVTSGGEFR